MAYWGTRPRYQTRPQEPINLGSGINTYLTPFEIDKNESPYSINTSSRNYPALSVCPGRATAFASISTPKGLGQRNNQYPHVIDGTVWKSWNGSAWANLATGLTNADAKFLEFNTEATRYTVMVNGTQKKSYDGSSVADLTDAPATNLYTVDDYRLYALLGSVLKCSAEGSITDWTTANDADSITITGMIGTGTAIASYNDVVVCWSEQSMHVLYGNDPYDFWLSDPMEDGCISDRSVIIHNGILYFLDFGKFKAYAGGKPKDISQKVKTYLEGINLSYKSKCVAGKDGKYIYLSIPYGNVTTNNITLEYDTELQNWYVRNVGYVGFVNIGEFLYGVDPSGMFHKINSGTSNNGTAITWEHKTGVWKDGRLRQLQTISDIYVLVDLPATSTLTLSYSTTADGDDFTLLHTFTGSTKEQNVRIQIPTTILQSVEYYRLKFSGTGPCTIHYVEPYIRVRER